MKRLFEDTTPEAEQVLIEGYRRMSAARKLQCIDELNHFAAEMQMAEIRRQHPDADGHELRMRLASRWIEPDLMLKAFGWDVEKQGF
jgi:hypothetical protein